LWGLRILDKDQELHGVSPNARVFVMISDGEAWSGGVARAIDRARDARVPIFAVGVGTLAGSWLPEVHVPITEEPAPHAISRLNRGSLQRIAERAGGQYFELDRDQDRDIANRIVDAGRRQAPPRAATPMVMELYPRFLTAAVALSALALVFAPSRVDAWLQLALAVGALAVVVRFVI